MTDNGSCYRAFDFRDACRNRRLQHIHIEKLRGELEVKMAEATVETIKSVTGVIIAQGAAVAALIKFLPGGH
jgi:hypothetical protein